MYASPLRGDPAAIYRQVDVSSRVQSASPHRLIQLLYEDLDVALRQAAFAIEKKQFEIKSARITKALAILFALEAGLDFTKGGDVAETLSRLYRGARSEVTGAGVSGDAEALRVVAANLAEIAAAWRQIEQQQRAAA
ncbi:flagellar export chaperone FliS [Sphingomonas sp. ID0503]|uniref:flagellar export chaperone FliS n=1 Tax=Sphingomonas sp. ID0503 TaxID=3399691 RepID=UPI003AFB4FEF